MRLRIIYRGAAYSIIAIGCAMLLGWFFAEPLLTGFEPGLMRMSVATSICFIMAGVALLAHDPEAKSSLALGPVACGLGVAILLVGFYALATYLPDPIRRLIPDGVEGGLVLGQDLGRVAPATAVSFMLFAFILLTPYPAAGRFNSALIALGMMISGLAFSGYAYDAEALSRTLPITAMALPTAICFTALFWGMALARPQYGWVSYLVAPGTGGMAARRLLPAIVLIPFLLGWLMVKLVERDAVDPRVGFAVLSIAIIFPLGLIACTLSAWLTRTEDTLRQAAATLVESELMARSIVDTSLDAFIQLDEAGNVTEWNPQAERTFGWPRDAAMGQPLADLIIPAGYRENHRQGILRYLRTGEAHVLGQRLELPALRRDGSEISVELTVTATRRAGGIRFNGFIRDLTEKIAVEAQLRQTQKMEAIGNLTGGLAHDFNNLLAVMIGNIDLLRDRIEDDGVSLKFADTALGAAERGADLTRRLLAFARRQPLAPQYVRVNDLVSGIVTLLRRVLGEAVEISLDLAPDIWPVVVDPAQLEAALTNLATNARDAMPRGGRLKIATRNCDLDADYAAQHADMVPGEFVMIEVSDTGIGMSGETMKQIFEPFFTTKGRDKGTGLGLSMAFGFAKQSGGHISVYSEQGVGSTFRLYLPRAAQAGAAAAAPSITAPVAQTRGTETVLVVEDNPELRKVVRNQLVELGYRVREAESAKAALQILSSEPVDLLFTDVVMPGGMNGAELAHEAVARWPALKVLLTSGFPDTKIEDFSEFARGWRLLIKPYRKTDLADAIRAALQDV